MSASIEAPAALRDPREDRRSPLGVARAEDDVEHHVSRETDHRARDVDGGAVRPSVDGAVGVRNDALAEALEPSCREDMPHGSPLVAVNALAGDQDASADGAPAASVGESVGLGVRPVRDEDMPDVLGLEQQVGRPREPKVDDRTARRAACIEEPEPVAVEGGEMADDRQPSRRGDDARLRLPGHGQPPSRTSVAPSADSDSCDTTSGCLASSSRTAERIAPVPRPWITRTSNRPASAAVSTNARSVSRAS